MQRRKILLRDRILIPECLCRMGKYPGLRHAAHLTTVVFSMQGTIENIFVARERHGEQTGVDAVQVKRGRGIVGDRFCGRQDKPSARNITLIEAEAIAAVNAALGLDIALQGPRRNLVTRGIRLNELVGRIFMIGDIRLQGMELCDPCIVLGRNLASAGHGRDVLIRAFHGRGGLRAALLDDGIIRQGSCITLADNLTADGKAY